MHPRAAGAVAVLVVLAAPALAGCVQPGTTGTGEVGGTSPIMPQERNAFGTLLGVTPAADGAFVFEVDADAVDCELNATRFVMEARIANGTVLPNDGVERAFWFEEDWREPGTWTFGGGFARGENRTAYAEDCSHRHAGDVTVGSTTAVRSGSSTSAARVAETAVVLGEEHVEMVRFRSTQDAPIRARVDVAYLVSEDAATSESLSREDIPPEEERMRDARIEGCSLDIDAGEFVIPPGGFVPVMFRILCDEDAETRPMRQNCGEPLMGGQKPGGPDEPEPGECRMEPVRYPHASIWARYSFRDELGHNHTVERYIRQFLYLGHDATLALSAPERVGSRDEVEILAAYRDADGNPIHPVQTTLTMTYPGMEDRGFPMTYDEAAGVYRFRWDDMHEWKPLLWREGTHTFTVHAWDTTQWKFVPRTASVDVEFS